MRPWMSVKAMASTLASMACETKYSRSASDRRVAESERCEKIGISIRGRDVSGRAPAGGQRRARKFYTSGLSSQGISNDMPDAPRSPALDPARGVFLADLAHDLSTPLTAIHGAIE